MTGKHVCRVCFAPVDWAYDEHDTLMLVDRQQSIAGDLHVYQDETERLRAVKSTPGTGQYSEHFCSRDSLRDRLRNKTAVDVDAALIEADFILSSRRKPVLPRAVHVIRILAAEVRRLRQLSH